MTFIRGKFYERCPSHQLQLASKLSEIYFKSPRTSELTALVLMSCILKRSIEWKVWHFPLIVSLAINALAIGRCNVRRLIYSNTWISSWGLLVIMLSGKSHWTLLMINQHWFREWLSAIKQQGIIEANVDPHMCHCMALPDYDQLMVSLGHLQLWHQLW